MEFRQLVENAAEDRYPGNEYVKNRIKKELDYLENTKRIKEIEVFLKIKELVKGEFFHISESSFLSFYLIGLSIGNPMPAHYYNPITKEVVFDDSKEFGVDLPKKENFVRDGFFMTEDYLINQDEKFFMSGSVNFKWKQEILQILEENFNYLNWVKLDLFEKPLFKSKFYPKNERIDFANSRISFISSTIKNRLSDLLEIDMEDFKDYIVGPYFKREFLDSINKEGYNNFLMEALEYYPNLIRPLILPNPEFLNIFNVTEILGADMPSGLELEIFYDDFKFPKNSQDIFFYLKTTQGYNEKQAANIARNLSNIECENPEFHCDDDEIKNFLLSTYFFLTKSEIIEILVGDYFENKLISEEIMRKQEELFSRWRNKYDNFISDGIVDPLWYCTSWLKATFILNESNDNEEFDLNKIIRNGANGAKWDNISFWSASLIFDKEYKDVQSIKEEDRKKYLFPISVINLKKTHKGESSKPKELEEIVKNDSFFIKEQLNIYNPDVIICCGSGPLFINQILELDDSNWTKKSDDFWYLWHDDKLIINECNPLKITNEEINYYFFENLILPIRDIINDKINESFEF